MKKPRHKPLFIIGIGLSISFAVCFAAFLTSFSGASLKQSLSRPFAQTPLCQSDEYLYKNRTHLAQQSAPASDAQFLIRIANYSFENKEFAQHQLGQFQFGNGESLYLLRDSNSNVVDVLGSPGLLLDAVPILLDIAGRYPLTPFGSTLGHSIKAFEYQIDGKTTASSDEGLDWEGTQLQAARGTFTLDKAFVRSKSKGAGLISIEGMVSLFLNGDDEQRLESTFQFDSQNKVAKIDRCRYRNPTEFIAAYKLVRFDLRQVKKTIEAKVLRERFAPTYDALAKLSGTFKLVHDSEKNKDQIARDFGELTAYYKAYPENRPQLFQTWTKISDEQPFPRDRALFLYDLILDSDDLEAQTWAIKVLSQKEIVADLRFMEHAVSIFGLVEAPHVEIFDSILALNQSTASVDLKETSLLALASYASHSDELEARAWDTIQSHDSGESPERDRNIEISAAGNLGSKAAEEFLKGKISAGPKQEQKNALDALARIAGNDEYLLTLGIKQETPLDIRRQAIFLLCGLDKDPIEEPVFRDWLEKRYVATSGFASDDVAESLFKCVRSRGASQGTSKAKLEDARFLSLIESSRKLKIWETF